MDVFSWNGADADSLSDQVLHVWSRGLGPIDDPARWRTERWDRHRSREGFRLVTAHHFGDVVGFAYGYTGELGQYWSDWVVDELGPAVDGWIGGHFEFTELGVLPAFRGRGIGGALHDALLHDLSHSHALLGTFSGPEDPASALYSRRGWKTLGTIGDSYRVMGKLLNGAGLK